MPFAVTGDRIQGSLQAKLHALRQQLARVGSNDGGKCPSLMMAVRLDDKKMLVQSTDAELMAENRELQAIIKQQQQLLLESETAHAQ
jgi:hypothetical protein